MSRRWINMLGATASGKTPRYLCINFLYQFGAPVRIRLSALKPRR